MRGPQTTTLRSASSSPPQQLCAGLRSDMRLDVIVPTYNRHELLTKTLDSLLAGEIPHGLTVSVTVVDNNSSDSTRPTVEAYQSQFAGRLRYVFEERQGKSHALNAGIAATDGDLVGMIDDDEEIDKLWYRRIYETFSDGAIDFMGGPPVAKWGGAPPAWLPPSQRGVIGLADPQKLRPHPYGTSDAQLLGGNAVIARAMLRKAGPYSADLGPQASRPLADEDTDMYLRLLAAGAKGLYVPELIVYHYIHPSRLTKAYFRRWHFWRGVSSGVLDQRRPREATYLFGVPRYLFGRAVRALWRIVNGIVSLKNKPAQAFADELHIWDLAGFFYGKHFYRAKDS